MRDLIPTIQKWVTEDKKIAMITVVKTEGSSLQPVGSKMIVSSKMEMAGSVSGGCVESVVIEESLNVVQSKKAKLLKFGISNEEAWEVGLACGGTLHVFVEPLNLEARNGVFSLLLEQISNKYLIISATILNGKDCGKKMLIFPDGKIEGDLGSRLINNWSVDQVNDILKNQDSIIKIFPGEDENIEIFFDVFPPPLKLIVVGAVHMAIPLVYMAKVMGFATYIIDSRAAFATHERFPHADKIIIGWPAEVLGKMAVDESTFLAFLSHDEKQDDPGLLMAIRSKARYIGALGSRKTHAKRAIALKELGATDEEISRIHAPIGLKLGARGADEIAVSILAEIISAKHGVSTG